MDDQDLPDLGAVQRDIMHLVWKHGPVTAEDVRAKLARPLKEVTVRTVLRKLEEKGYVGHTVDGRTFVYSAMQSREHVAARAVRRVVDWFCDGSLEDALLGMVDTALLDERELRRLATKLAKTKRGKK